MLATWKFFNRGGYQQHDCTARIPFMYHAWTVLLILDCHSNYVGPLFAPARSCGITSGGLVCKWNWAPSRACEGCIEVRRYDLKGKTSIPYTSHVGTFAHHRWSLLISQARSILPGVRAKGRLVSFELRSHHKMTAAGIEELVSMLAVRTQDSRHTGNAILAGI